MNRRTNGGLDKARWIRRRDHRGLALHGARVDSGLFGLDRPNLGTRDSEAEGELLAILDADLRSARAVSPSELENR